MKKRMVKALSLLMCVMLAAAMFAATALAADNVTVAVSSASGKKGETVTVEVTISEKSNVGDAGLFVAFDPAKLEYVSSKGGSIDGMAVTGIPKDAEGKEIPGKVSVAIALNETLQEKSVIAKITFKILDDSKNIPLTLEINTVSAYDAENNKTDLTNHVKSSNGTITVTSDPAPTEKPTTAPTEKPTEKPTAQPTETTTAASTTAENVENPNTGESTAIVAACSVLAAAAGAAMVLTRKKKGA